ncbi:hypothetical protein ACIPSJ_50010 [Streptomyces sp. NPDC090088]|uniref:hypothetical protein n=1 Tax=Streptomyces sp. NPDC090088 TaxID=3365944 RepID=UPI00382DF248
MSTVDLCEPEPVPWVRYCYLPTENEQDAPLTYTEGDPRPLEDLRDVPALVLMAERGSGKTHVLEAEAKALHSEGLTVCLLDLGDLAQEPDLAAALAQQATPPPDGGVWHVLLDSYDEALSRTERPYWHLEKWWKSLPEPARAGLRLRIATRPGLTAAGTPLRQALTRTWDTDGVQFRELTRLNDEAVATAARHFGLDPAAFAVTVQRRGLQPLVSLPVTLLELLRDAAEGRDLPATATEAYARSCDRWCHETNDEREPPKDSEVKALLAAAEQAAAALHLCTARPVLTTRPDARPAEALRVSDLADGPEAGARVTETALRGLMHTGLMSWIDHHRGKFALRSIQEFLASQYLRHHHVPSATLQTLLITGQGPSRHAVTAVRDLAGWVASWDDTVFDDLLAHDPHVLLSTDLAARPHPDADRARLVETLLYRVGAERNGSLAPHGPLLYRLDHPGLPEQLTPHLSVPSADHEYPRLGAALLVIQAAGPQHRPVEPLLLLAEDQTVRPGWRAAALRCLPHQLTPHQQQRIRALAVPPADEDIRAAAVETLWPDCLDLTELLDLAEGIPAGRLTVLLDDGQPDPLRVLAWARRQLAEPPTATTPPTNSYRAGAAQRVARAAHALAWALDQVPAADPNDRLETALADVVADLAARADLWDHTNTAGFPEQLHKPVADGALRRRLAGLLLDRRADSTDLLHLLDGPFSFFPPQDRIHWACRFTALSDTAKDFLPTVLARGIDRLPTPEETTQLQQLTSAHPQLARLIQAWSQPPERGLIPAPRARSEEQWRARWRFDPEALEADLALRPSGEDLRPWWSRITAMVGFRTPAGDPPALSAFHDVLDLTTTPCWATARNLPGDLAAATTWALHNAPVITPDDAKPVVGFCIADVPELRALTAVPALPSLSPQRWTGIAVALLCAQVEPPDDTLRHTLISDALKRAGQAFGTALPDYLERLPPDVAGQAVTRLAAVDPAQLAPVTAWAAAPNRLPEQRRPILRPLAAAGITQALDLTRADTATAQRDGSPAPAAAWAQTVNVLLEYAPAPERESTWDQILADPALTDAWIMSTDTTTGILTMAPSQLGTLYERLVAAGHVTTDGPLYARSGIGHPGIPVGIALTAIPDTLASRTPTPQSLTELERLADIYPDHPRLPGLAHWHALMLAETAWERPSWPTLAALAADTDRRIVHHAAQLAHIVLDALKTIQHQLTGPNGLAPLLWNRTHGRTTEQKPKKGQAAPPPWRWWPMWEEDLSDLVHHLLQTLLAGHRLIINREVQIDRYGRTDIQIDANHRWDTTAPKVTVIIETKGCWNRGVDEAARTQLAERYLTRDRTAAGIYLVGYFDSPAFWTNVKPGEDGRPADDRRHTAHTLDDLAREQHELSASLKTNGAEIYTAILDCRPDPIETITGGTPACT